MKHTVESLVARAQGLATKNKRARRKGESRIRRKMARMSFLTGRERFKVAAALLEAI